MSSDILIRGEYDGIASYGRSYLLKPSYLVKQANFDQSTCEKIASILPLLKPPIKVPTILVPLIMVQIICTRRSLNEDWYDSFIFMIICVFFFFRWEYLRDFLQVL